MSCKFPQTWWAVARVLSCLVLLGADPHEEEPPRGSSTWLFGLTPNYSSGTYGTGTRTDITYVPLSIQRLFGEGDVSLVVPFISVKGDGSVVLLSGLPNRRTPLGTAPGPPVTQAGLGDIVLRGRHYLLDEQHWWPTVALTARLKIPTASSSRGLGTGKFDEGFGMETSKFVTEKLVLYMDAGFTFVGKPAGDNFRNQWNYDVGLGYYFTNALVAGVYFEEYRAVIEGNQNPQDVLMTLNYDLTPRVGLNAFTMIGLSDGAPEYAVSAGLAVKY